MNQSDLFETLKQENQRLVAENAKLVQAIADLQGKNVGVTLNNGERIVYDADFYALLPNKHAPTSIEFRKRSEKGNTYRAVAHVRFSEVKEVHGPSAFV